MKTHYDPVADALYLRFGDDRIAESEEVSPGIVLDFDRDGRLVAVEIMPASRHLARDGLAGVVAAPVTPAAAE